MLNKGEGLYRMSSAKPRALIDPMKNDHKNREKRRRKKNECDKKRDEQEPSGRRDKILFLVIARAVNNFLFVYLYCVCSSLLLSLSSFIFRFTSGPSTLGCEFSFYMFSTTAFIVDIFIMSAAVLYF